MSTEIKLEGDWKLVLDPRYTDCEAWILKRGRKIADRIFGPCANSNEPNTWRGTSCWAGKSALEVAWKTINSHKKFVATIQRAIENGGIAEL